jgi:polyisoprenoid-binding protein YceI
MKLPIAKRSCVTIAICLLSAALAARANAQQNTQEIVLRCAPDQTRADFTLGDVLHTVKGSFKEKQCEIHFDPATGKLGGEIVFDAATGQSGNASRDHKMRKDVLESERYPEISFRPDHVEGKVSAPGTSSMQVHGTFGIHGAEHELTVSVVVKLEADRWEASSHFQVPYVKWGLKNPSVLLLRVGDTVDIDLRAAGSLTAPGPP